MTTVSELELLIAQRRDEMSWLDLKQHNANLQREAERLSEQLAAAKEIIARVRRLCEGKATCKTILEILGEG